MHDKIIKFILWGQGLYYSVTGLWAIIALDHFSRTTGHFGEAFDIHSVSALAVVLGIAFLWGARKKEYRYFAAWLAVGSACAVFIPELAYFSEVKNTLFAYDVLEEFAVATSLLFVLKTKI